MLVVVILILSILLSVTFVVIGKSYNRIEDLNKEVIKLKSDVKKVEEVIQIEPGDKALLPDYGLTSKTDNVNFHVDFEVEILEVSVDQVKVKAVDYTSLDTYPNDSKNKQSIIKCAFDAGATILFALVINMFFSYVLFGFVVPNNVTNLFYFCILAFLIGYILDILIYKFKIFGDRLDVYYKTLGAGFWGGLAFVFSIVVSYFMQKNIYLLSYNE